MPAENSSRKKPALRNRKKANRKTKFVYEHPDLIRKYIKDGPCKGCEFEQLCDVPCAAYFHWWDVRMELLRRRING